MNHAGQEDTLDPDDWNAMRTLAHTMVDDAITRLQGLRDGPVWQPMPADLRSGLNAPVPIAAESLESVYSDVVNKLYPHAMGNVHPRFWAWYRGAGCFTGALADFLAAVDGSNLGGSDTAASIVDRQVTDWLQQMMGFPDSASGTLVNGGCMANIIGLAAARNTRAGVDLHMNSVADMAQSLRFYSSDQANNCHQKAMNLLGLGSKSLAKVPSDADFRMDTGALQQMITEDRARNVLPACVIATAGTTNTGSIDPLSDIADLCAREDVWLHIDTCIGPPYPPGSRKPAPRCRNRTGGFSGT